MGKMDRLVRLVVAAVILVLYFTEVISGTLGLVLLLLGGVFVLTSLLNFCPLYLPFGINTCSTKEKEG